MTTQERNQSIRNHFDHINPQEKTYTIADILDKPIQILLMEIEKCQLLCFGCHLKKTRKNKENPGGAWRKLPEESFVHGTARMYNTRRCRCKYCREANRLYKKKLILVDELI